MRILLPSMVLLIAGASALRGAPPPDACELLALQKLAQPPAMHAAEGFAPAGAMRPIFFDGLPFHGKPTRVFAWLGVPAGAKEKVPGIVLVHGGGGTAFSEWVRRWNAEGFAAIAIAVEGQTDQREEAGGKTWRRHAWAGPARVGIYGDSAQPLADQWMFHAVADTILARLLLRALPEVDAEKVGVMGISWGGVIATTTIGIDPRFAFAIPTYGTGRLDQSAEHYRRALAGNTLYREMWEPALRLPRAKMPVLWFTWLRDHHTPLTAQRACYRAAGGPRQIAVLPDMRHGHAPAWTPPDSYAFAKAIVATGQPWARMLSQEHDAAGARAEFETSKPVQSAVLLHTASEGFTGAREWQQTPAQLTTDGTRLRVTAPLPLETRAYFFSLDANGLTVSSEFAECTP